MRHKPKHYVPLIKMKPHEVCMAVYFASDSSIAIGVVRDKTKPQYGIIITIITVIIKYNNTNTFTIITAPDADYGVGTESVDTA